MSIRVRSDAFADGEAIPKKHTEDGEDVSPRLSWSAVPEGAAERALIVDDPDAPTAEPWVHWVLYKIPGTATDLLEGIATDDALTEPRGALQGKNSWGTVGYRGPAPPRGHGTHHYHFKLYALDAELQAASGLSKRELLALMQGHVLAEGELMGTYSR